MITPSIPRNISFRVDTLFTKKGGRVGRLRCDENGVYKGLPLMVLGETTQQNTYYDPQSVVDQITNPNTGFNKRYSGGKLLGEYGHPAFPSSMSATDQITRLTTVDEKSTSHLFTNIYTDPPSPDGTVIVRGDVKPTGPFGSVMKEGLDDPIVNTAFSLRAYVDTQVRPDGLKFRTVRSLTTWDTVGASGYKGTDKANAIGLESFSDDRFIDYEVNVMKDGTLLIDQIALESYSNTELNEIFGTNDVARIIQSRTIVETDKSMQQRYPNLYQQSIFNDFFKEI